MGYGPTRQLDVPGPLWAPVPPSLSGRRAGDGLRKLVGSDELVGTSA